MTEKLKLTKVFVTTICANSLESYRLSLKVFGIPKKKEDDLAAGFKDGMSAVLAHLVAADLVEVVE